MSKHVNSRFVAVGQGYDGAKPIKYNEDESKLATAIFRAKLEDGEIYPVNTEISLSDDGIAKAEAERLEMIKRIWGE